MSQSNGALHVLILGLATAVLVVVNIDCRGETACAQGAAAEISGNHGHTTEVPAEHVKRGVGGSYAIKGGDHEHVVSLKDADMAELKAGKKVRTIATSVNGHTHEVEVACK
jgi:hypothetical protein